MSRQTAGECIWPDRPFYHPQRHSSQDRPAGRDEHRQHRSFGDRHARNGAHAVWHISRTAPTTAQQTTMRRMKTESTRDAIQYQSVILWTAHGAELVMAGFPGFLRL